MASNALSSAPLHNPARARAMSVPGACWFAAVHVLGIIGLGYAYLSWHPYTVLLAVLFYFTTMLGIRCGMHSLHSHAAFKCVKPLEAALLLFSSCAIQKSNLWWAARHREHHAYSDTERDPYTVRHGFWWAHIWWILYAAEEVEEKGAGDLLRNRLLMLQHKWYVPLSLVCGLGVPTAIAALWEDALGGFLVAGCARLICNYHFTFAINSVAHCFGRFRFVRMGTARSAAHWIIYPVFTLGESSSHERHHHAPRDYRIDTRWWALDPGKWFLWICEQCGLAWDLHRDSDEKVLKRIQRKMEREVPQERRAA